MKEFTSQMGRVFEMKTFPPKKIVSLVPSISELLCDLGLEKELAGITDYCVEPPRLLEEKQTIGGTKNIKIPRVRNLHPDLIIGAKEENLRQIIERLEKEYPVYMADARDFDSAIEMIRQIGMIAGKEKKAASMAGEIIERFNEMPAPAYKRSAAYIIWKKPLMAAAGKTFISSMMGICGFENIFAAAEGNYPKISMQLLAEKQPEALLLTSEPWEFTEGDIPDFKKILPDSEIILADGQYFTWYGSRMLKAPQYFAGLIK